MAKRVRGSSRQGQRRPVARRPARPSTATPASSSAATLPTGATPAAAAPRSPGLTDAEVKRAAELEAQLVAEEQAADAARRKSVARAGAVREVTGSRALRPEEEYAYVARDLKDIVRIATLLLVVLFVLYLAIDVAGVFKIT